MATPMNVHVNDPISDRGLAVLKDHGLDVTMEPLEPTALRRRVADCHGLIVRSGTTVPRELLQNAEYLKVVGRAGVGVDNIDVEACRDLGIAVVNAPTAASESVAELTLAHMLALCRRLPRADREVKAGGWPKKELKGTELMGKTLGLVGSGRIGSRVAELAGAFGMEVLTYDPYLTADDAADFGAELVDDLHAMLGRSDVVSVHCPLTDETRHILDADAFGAMRPGALVVNCARGGVVDEAALADALADGTVAGAALDVFETEPPEKSPLLDLPDDANLVLSPHVGAATREAQDRVGVICAEQVVAVLDGDEPTFRVA